MRIKKFIVHHRKLVSVLMAVFVLLAVGGAALFYSNDTKAEVYIKNENDKYVARDEIQILEIVAEKGQQVFGYTVSGCEPITKEAIRNYKGDVSQIDVTELGNLTGYSVTSDGKRMEASASVIENAFNTNVLSDSMSNGQIHVTVCQANELTADLIHNADLIFINTNNYGCDNALYYYDQIMNGGAGGVTKGSKGAFYNSSIEIKKDAYEYIIENFKKACGRMAVAKRITVEDYKRIGITNFKECNFAAYRSELASKAKGTFDSISLTNLQPILDMVERVNNMEYSSSVRIINNSYNTSVVDEAKKENLYTAMLKAGLNDVLEVNRDAYVEMIVTRTSSFKTFNKIQSEITKVAVGERAKGLARLIEYEDEGKTYDTINDDRKKEVRDSILKMAVPEAESGLAEAYAIVFMEPEFQFTNKEDSEACLADIKALVMQVNETKKMESIQLIADAVEDDTALTELKTNPAMYFQIASLDGGVEGDGAAEGYVDYNTDAYIKKLETLEDQALKTDGVADTKKIKSVLFDVVNEESKYTIDYITSDISWEMALELYEYAIVDEKALMYDSKIMSTAGNYKDDLSTNTCNMYKILMLMRQLQPAYCQGEILPKIDELGTYYPEGIGKGTGITAWYRGTFCAEFATPDAADKTKFREPAVRGYAYATDGTQGKNTNYVYKHIYSFTGDQFFGGPGFIHGTNGDNFNSNNTAKDNQEDPAENESLTEDQTMPLEGQSAVKKTSTKAKIIRYIMELELNFYDSYPIRILELQPGSGDSYWANPANEYANLDKLAEYLGVTPVKEAGEGDDYLLRYFEVTRMSVREFNTRQEDLTGVYDLIYIGVEPGYMPVDKNGRTVFNCTNASELKGYVYYSIGPIFDQSNYTLRGTASSDYKKNVDTRPKVLTELAYNYWLDNYASQIGLGWHIYSLKTETTANAAMGNDLTVKSMNRLFEYARAGYPIAMDIGVYNCDGTGSSGYVHKNTKMYNFVHILKQLGYSTASGDFDGVSVGDLKIKDLSGFEPSLGDIINGSIAGGKIFKDGYNFANLVRINEANPDGNYALIGRNPANDAYARTGFRGGLKHAMKRSTKVSFELVESPQQYQYKSGITKVYSSDEDDSAARIANGGVGTVVSDTRNYRFVVDVKSTVDASWLEQNYTYQVIIDKSGTGRFEDKDVLTLDPSHVYKKDADNNLQVVMQGRWPGDMEGYIPWRVEISKKDNPENHYTYTGYSAFRTKNKKTVYLLWVMTEATVDGYYLKGEYDNNGNIVDIKKDDFNLNFAKAIYDNKNYIEDYEIKLVSLTYSEYLALYSGLKNETFSTDAASKLKIKAAYNKRGTNLNKAKGLKASGVDTKKSPYCNLSSSEVNALGDDKMFDMIVFGFSDTYQQQDITSVAALNDLKYFIASGRSFMFAHDNASYVTTMNHLSWSTWSIHTGPIMRSVLGMDAFGAGYSKADNKNADMLLAKNNARKYVDCSNDRYLRGYTDMFTDLYAKYNKGGSTVNGSLPWARTMYMHTKAATGTSTYDGVSSFSGNVLDVKSFNEVNRTQRVKRTNQGQLSDYPFVIGETLDIATTHAQYLNLNLEFEDMTVWYTLHYNDSSKIYNKGPIYKANQGDGAGNYYIYSKGNVTYTGAGHDPAMTKTEIRLFINTVVAAIKAGNWAPEVVYPDAQSNAKGESVIDHYSEEKNGLIVAFKPIDYDSANIQGVFTDCKIYIDKNGNNKYDAGDYPLFIDRKNNNLKVPGTNTPIDLTGTGLINKQRYDFEIPQSVLDELGNAIYEFPITIQLTDAGTKLDPTKKTEIISHLWVAKAELHNLR